VERGTLDASGSGQGPVEGYSELVKLLIVV